MASASTRVRRLAAAALLVAAAAACEGTSLPGFSFEPGASPGGSLREGHLVGDSLTGCVVLQDVSGQQIPLLWPAGYKVKFDPLRILAKDREVATSDVEVFIGGTDTVQVNPNCRTGPSFAVLDISTENPIDPR